MLLLRNKFFKSCAFKTKLQKWFKDKNITLEDLKARGFVTLATDISQILMVTTPNSMKFLKFMDGGLTQENVKKWSDNVDSTFGVVKYDKRTKFFGGKMVQSSYQLINTLGLNEQKAEELLTASKDYLTTIRKDYDFMRYHFSNAYKKEQDELLSELSDGLEERADLIFSLMNVNYGFSQTELYYNFRNDVVENQKSRLKQGHILLSGTNATLFGNGPEMLFALSGEFDLYDLNNKSMVLGKGEVACAKFKDGEKLVCARSPHITMGNLYCATNNLSNDVWNYFDLGENIVCVNALGENIQQRLNGCDYDSDAMLITNDSLIVQTAFKQKDFFGVPVCNIKSSYNQNITLAELDHNTSENKIGNIVNLSQKLNSLLWDMLNNGADYQDQAVQEIYKNVCKLAVLSGIEIDKAKRSYDNVSVFKEIGKINKNLLGTSPEFFREIDFEDNDKIREYSFYNTPMEYVYKSAKSIDYRLGKEKKKEYISILQMLKEPKVKSASTVYAKKNKIVEICNEYKEKIEFLYKGLRFADEDEKDVIFEKIKQTKEERNQKVQNKLTEEYVLYLVLKEFQTKTGENWHLYAPLLESQIFRQMLKDSKEQMLSVFEDAEGEFELYGLRFTKK